MKTQNPWMGRVRGSAGNMTGCKVYDKNVLRAKAFEVSNPDTAAQQTQRSFFKDVAAIVATVSEEELRSLFGIKPKGMSRRNALSKQVAAAYSVEGSEKTVDFSKLEAIGNGAKVTSPICEVVSGATEDQTEITPSLLGSNADASTNLILVFFNTDKNAIEIFNTNMLAGDGLNTCDVVTAVTSTNNGFAYVTCATDGRDVSSLPLGSFTIKTRSNGKQTPAPPTPEVITVHASGLNAWDTFSFDTSGTSAAGVPPVTLSYGNTTLCSSFNSVGDNTYTGSFLVDVADPNECIIVFNDLEGTVVELPAVIVVD